MPELPVTFDDVRRAAAVIDGHVRRTPVFSCASLGEGVWLKAELLQRTGAFKVSLNQVVYDLFRTQPGLGSCCRCIRGLRSCGLQDADADKQQ